MKKDERFKKWKRTKDLKWEWWVDTFNLEGADSDYSLWVWSFQKKKRQFLALLIERIKFWRQKLVWAQELHSQERICKLFFETSFSENSSSNSFQTRNWLLTISDSKVCSLQKRSDNWNVWFVLLKNISLFKTRRRIFHWHH